jgi:two-component system, OmpR family, response regulator ResD
MQKILIVEDEEILRGLISQELRRHDYQVVEAENGAEALKIVQAEEAFDLVLSDLLMPVMDGYDFIRELRRHERYNGVPIVVLSNSGYVEDLNHAFSLGATDVLVKADFTPSVLVGRVNSRLRSHADVA